MGRRAIVGIIGRGGEQLPESIWRLACDVGRYAVEAGFRVVTGGRTGVMEAASHGAHQASNYREGDVIGILPNYDGEGCNAFVDVPIRTGMSIARDIIVVATADVLVAVGGGAGTLGELAVAWQLERAVVGLEVDGWSGLLAGSALDDRHPTQIVPARTPREAIEHARGLLYGRPPQSR